MSYPEPYVYDEHNRMVKKRLKLAIKRLFLILAYPITFVLPLTRPFFRWRAMRLDDSWRRRVWLNRINECTFKSMHEAWLVSFFSD